MPGLDWLLLALVTLAAAAIQGATGFGFAVLAVPFYLAILGSLQAVPLAIAGSLAVSAVLAPGLWRTAPRARLARLCLGTLAGLPLGLWLFAWASLDAVRIAVALLIVGFALALLLARPPERVRAGSGAADLAVGLVSGAMTAALAMPGPAVLLYLQAVGLPKQATRATTLSLFVFSYLSALALAAGVGGLGRGIWLTAALLAPLAVAGALAGHLVSGRYDERVFRTAVLAILIAAGLYTLWSALAR